MDRAKEQIGKIIGFPTFSEIPCNVNAPDNQPAEKDLKLILLLCR